MNLVGYILEINHLIVVIYSISMGLECPSEVMWAYFGNKTTMVVHTDTKIAINYPLIK